METESEQELRGYAIALNGILRGLFRQERRQKTVRKELDRRMREGELTKEQNQEMRRELDEARELAERTECEAFELMQEILDELSEPK